MSIDMVSSVSQMTFLEEISIPNKPFPPLHSIFLRGVGAMEIVAMDMKLRGMYIARQLSFTGVTFKIEEVPLTTHYIKMYNKSVRLVRNLDLIPNLNITVFPGLLSVGLKQKRCVLF